MQRYISLTGAPHCKDLTIILVNIKTAILAFKHFVDTSYLYFHPHLEFACGKEEFYIN